MVNYELGNDMEQAHNSKFQVRHSKFKKDLPERTFEFARRVVELCRVLDQTPGVSRTLATQLLRSGTSIGANVEEGQAAQSRADFSANSP